MRSGPRRLVLSTVATLAIVLLMSSPTLHADPTISGNGGLYLDMLSWYSTSSSPVGQVYLGGVSCQSACGDIRMDIDWDDGTVDTYFMSLPASMNQWFSHWYADNGQRHVKIHIEDAANGNWLHVEPIDLWITYWRDRDGGGPHPK
jgi:hypothetical protein